MRSTLEKFQLAKLNPLKDKLSHNHYHINVSMLSLCYNADRNCTLAFVLYIDEHVCGRRR